MTNTNQKMPLVAVIVLNWNSWKDTVACVHSLKKLNYDNYKIIVIDNGSTDDSEIQLKQLSGITFLQSGKNFGYGGGNNVGIQYAIKLGCDYVWVLNNDTEVDPNALNALVEYPQSDSCIIGSVIYHFGQRNKVQVYGGGYVNRYFGNTTINDGPLNGKSLDFISGASILLSKKIINKLHGFDDRFFLYWEDVDLCFRSCEAGFGLQVADSSFVYHKDGGANNSPKRLKTFNESAMLFYWFHGLYHLLLLGFVGRVIKRISRLDMRSMVPMWQGFCAGFKKLVKN